MKVPGIIVARTDAEAATLLEGRGDERDHGFILGATETNLPSYKAAFLAVLKRFYDKGVKEINGHLLYSISRTAYAAAYAWLDKRGVLARIDQIIQALKQDRDSNLEAAFEKA